MILHYSFGDDYRNYDFDYEIDNQDVQNGIAQIVEPYSKDIAKSTTEYTQRKIASFIKDNEIEETMFEKYEDELKEYFEEEARESYEASKEYEKDPLGYYGMSQKDFF